MTYPTSRRSLGLRGPSNPLRARLRLRDFVRVVPDHPIAVDDAADVVYGLDGNDRWGVCVPTGKDNLHRTVSRLLTGAQVSMTQDQIFIDYRSQNPNFNPDTGTDDNGMVIQEYLEYLVHRGDILGFASVDLNDEDEVRAATYLFLGLLVGVNLDVAQQSQTDRGLWDYVAGSRSWGGHCVAQVGYAPAGDKAITWNQSVTMTPTFCARQRFEAWVVLFGEHVTHPGFRAGFDLPKYAHAFTDITGRPFPAVVPPEPEPPVPPAPGGGVWFRLDPANAAAVHQAAVRRGLNDTDELNRVVRQIFHSRSAVEDGH